VRPFLPLVIAMLTIALSASAQFINWVQYINPTDRNDRAFGVCLFGDYLAVVGTANGDEFVALLDKATGEVIKTWEGEYGLFFNCLSIGDRLYVVGSDIYIFDKGLNVVKRANWGRVDWLLLGISFDGSYLYLAGWMRKDVDGHDNWVWRIEKRTLDLDLVAYREFYKEWDKTYSYGSAVFDIAVNPATGDLWTVGMWTLINRTSESWINNHSLLVIFDKQLDVKRIVEYPEGQENYLHWLYGICFDDDGNAYVVGGWGVAKFDKYGKLLAVNKKAKGSKIACIKGRVYVFGETYVGKELRHIFYVLDKELNFLGEHVLSKDVEADSWFWPGGRPAFDGRNLYVAGWDEALDYYNTRIVVYSISLPTVRVVVQVVDGFGQPRDWPVEVEGVVSGVGRVEAEVVEGQRYVAKAAGLGFTNTTTFVARGPQMAVTIRIPTAKLAAQAKDGFGKVRSDWPVEVVGVAAGQGTVGPVEVLAGQYTVKAVVFGKDFTQTVTLQAGQSLVAAVQVPTAVLSIVAVDDYMKPIDKYVTAVEISGPLTRGFSTPPRDVEVLAGQYTIRVRALNKESLAQVELQPGEVKTVEVVVPGTAGLDFGGSRIPLPTLVFYAGGVLAVIIASVFAAVRLRRKGIQTREAPLKSGPQPHVGETSAVGDFCLEYQGGVIPLAAYTVVGRGDFSGLPERVLEMVDERHFAVYYRDGVWWVEDLGSRRGTYLNGVRVRRERLREGDVVSPGAAVAAVFKRCGTTRRVVPMEEEGTKTY